MGRCRPVCLDGHDERSGCGSGGARGRAGPDGAGLAVGSGLAGGGPRLRAGAARRRRAADDGGAGGARAASGLAGDQPRAAAAQAAARDRWRVGGHRGLSLRCLCALLRRSGHHRQRAAAAGRRGPGGSRSPTQPGLGRGDAGLPARVAAAPGGAWENPRLRNARRGWTRCPVGRDAARLRSGHGP